MRFSPWPRRHAAAGLADWRTRQIHAWAVFFAWCLAQAPPFLQAGLPFSATTGAGQMGGLGSGCRLPRADLPGRLTPLALSGGAVISSLTPIGMMNPIVAAMAFFPA